MWIFSRYFIETFVFLNKHFLRNPCELIVLDNFITSGDKGELPETKNIAFVEHDIIKPFYPERPVDFILHAAGIASPFYYRKYPLETLAVATTGLQNALELAQKSPGSRLLFFSSSEIYGDPDSKYVPTQESYRGNVSCIGPRACYDSKTDILTENGWVPFSELSKGIRVATLNSVGKVEYYIPDEYINYEHNGDMIHFWSDRLDLNVTPDHNLYVKDKSNKFRFIKAGGIKYGKSWRVPSGVYFSGGKEIKWKKFDKNLSRLRSDLRKVNMDDWLEFLGYYISEGCVYIRKTKEKRDGTRFVRKNDNRPGLKEYNISRCYILISQVKPEGRKKIASCLNRININYMDSDHHQFRICSKFLVDLLSPLGKAKDKYIPREYMCLSLRQSKILFDALVLGDGTIKKGKNGRKGGNIIYYTKSKRLADDVQELALRVGYAACISKSTRGLYHVNIRKSGYTKLSNIQSGKYSGRVYCVNVKNHVICVRRNGKAVWCGNCYDESKRLGETLIDIFHQQYGVHATIVRPFNIYGPGMLKTDYRVLPNFGARIKEGKSLQIYGTGNQTRTFCYITDAIRGFLQVLVSGVPGEPYNIGNPSPEISMVDLAYEIGKILGKEVKFDIVEYPDSYPADEPNRRCPDITKAARQVGYEPSIPLQMGLKRFFDWVEEAYK